MNEIINYISENVWTLNLALALLILIIPFIYNHWDYIKLKRLWSEHQHHEMAAHITMRESGIFTKTWIRTFVKGAERWF